MRRDNTEWREEAADYWRRASRRRKSENQIHAEWVAARLKTLDSRIAGKTESDRDRDNRE